jgi:hypothetical protein
MNPQGFNLLLLYQCISIFLFEPVTVSKKRHESYASLPTKVKEQRNAKRRQDYQRKKVEKEASMAVAAEQHQEVTPVC